MSFHSSATRDFNFHLICQAHRIHFLPHSFLQHLITILSWPAHLEDMSVDQQHFGKDLNKIFCLVFFKVCFLRTNRGPPNSNYTIPDAYFSILSIIFWCLKYVFSYSRHGHIMIYHHFLTLARYFFTIQFFHFFSKPKICFEI